MSHGGDGKDVFVHLILVAFFEDAAQRADDGFVHAPFGFLGGHVEDAIFEINLFPCEFGDVSQTLSACVEANEDHVRPFVGKGFYHLVDFFHREGRSFLFVVSFSFGRDNSFERVDGDELVFHSPVEGAGEGFHVSFDCATGDSFEFFFHEVTSHAYVYFCKRHVLGFAQKGEELLDGFSVSVLGSNFVFPAFEPTLKVGNRGCLGGSGCIVQQDVSRLIAYDGFYQMNVSGIAHVFLFEFIGYGSGLGLAPCLS